MIDSTEERKETKDGAVIGCIGWRRRREDIGSGERYLLCLLNKALSPPVITVNIAYKFIVTASTKYEYDLMKVSAFKY